MFNIYNRFLKLQNHKKNKNYNKTINKNKIILLIIAFSSFLIFSGCSDNSGDFTPVNAAPEIILEGDLTGYSKLNNICYKIENYNYTCNNNGTAVYYTDDEMKCISICAKDSSGAKSEEVKQLYDDDLSGYYGDSYKSETYDSNGRTWYVYDFTDGTKNDDDIELKGFLYADEKYIIYIEAQAYNDAHIGKEAYSLIDSIVFND